MNQFSPRPAPPTPKPLPYVKKVIAVAAGKGGVGKSTVSVNLAVALAKKGLNVGLVDADIYGPSIARMMNISEKPEVNEGLMTPIESYSVKTLSMGMLIPEGEAVVWRGPMLSKAMKQLTSGARWGNAEEPIDVLVIDLPPGTGDVLLSLSQRITIDGIIMVSTPQDVALIDVRKAISMCNKIKLPVLGIVENMAYVENSDGSKNYVFGQGNVDKLASELNLKKLAEIAIDSSISEAGDKGKPTLSNNNSKLEEKFNVISEVITAS